jgi:hypothetical protein
MLGVTPARTNPLFPIQTFTPAAWRQAVLLALSYSKRQATNNVGYLLGVTWCLLKIEHVVSAVYKREEIWNPKHCRHKNVNILQKKWM